MPKKQELEYPEELTLSPIEKEYTEALLNNPITGDAKFEDAVYDAKVQVLEKADAWPPEKYEKITKNWNEALDLAQDPLRTLRIILPDIRVQRINALNTYIAHFYQMPEVKERIKDFKNLNLNGKKEFIRKLDPMAGKTLKPLNEVESQLINLTSVRRQLKSVLKDFVKIQGGAFALGALNNASDLQHILMTFGGLVAQVWDFGRNHDSGEKFIHNSVWKDALNYKVRKEYKEFGELYADDFKLKEGYNQEIKRWDKSHFDELLRRLGQQNEEALSVGFTQSYIQTVAEIANADLYIDEDEIDQELNKKILKKQNFYVYHLAEVLKDIFPDIQFIPGESAEKNGETKYWTPRILLKPKKELS